MKKIKWAWQRVVRGYDDRVMWGFEEYFEIFIPAIELHCNNWLKDKEIARLNSNKTIIIIHMLKLIKDFKDNDYGFDDYYKENNSCSRLWEYFGKNIGYFWN